MDVIQKIRGKLERILKRLKILKVIQSFKLEINFCEIEENSKTNLVIIDSVLKKCLRRIITRPRKAEIRNIISEIVKKKNFGDTSVDLLRKTKKEFQSAFINDQLEYATNLRENCDFFKNENVKKLNCNVNKKGFEIQNKVTTHKHSHKKVKKYLCEMCGKTLSDTVRLKYHKRKHISELKIGCREHLKPFYKVKDLNFGHENQETSLNCEKLPKCQKSGEAFFKCKDCRNTFESEDLLEHHSTKEHHEKMSSSINNVPFTKVVFEDTKFICRCGKIFRLLKSLKKHEIIKHSPTNSVFNCDVCKKKFMEKGKLNRHMLSHKSSKYKCSFCTKQFARSDALRRHLSTTHYSNKNYNCSFCQKKFNLKYNKDVHEENIHRNRNNWIQCDQCGDKFRNKITFKKHMKTHSEKPMTCNVCHKSFTRKILYKNHMMSKHTVISSFQKLLDSVAAGELN